MQDIGYYIQNWNTDMVSVAAIICILLVVSGYFYGKIFQHFIEPLKKIDCTFLGVIFIFAMFQVFTFYAVPNETSATIGLYLSAILIIASPLLCLVTWSNPLPSWNNLGGLVCSLLVVYVLGRTSSELTTNNIYFDSVHYMSAVLENSVQDIFAHMNYYNGKYLFTIDPLHDFEGIVYFWGTALRWVRELTKIKDSLTPVYLWGASLVYWAGLGNLIWNSVTVLFEKWWKIIGIAAAVCVLSPYYTNYWNSTLAFFGNSLRTVIIGFSCLIVYLYVKEKDGKLFLIQLLCTLAAMFASSSAFFIEAFITAGVFFYMTWTNEEQPSAYYCFILSILPIVHFAVIATTDYYRYYWEGMRFIVPPVLVLLVIAFLIRNHLDLFNKVMRWLFPVALAGLLAVSYLKRGGEFPYSFWFEPRSNMDMCNNFTCVFEDRDYLRNILLYIMLACLVLRPLGVEKDYKLFLFFTGLLFMTPLTVPAVATYMTSAVYSRTFDIIVNPFTLTFLLANIFLLLKNEKWPWLYVLGVIPLGALAWFSWPFGVNNLEVPHNNSLVFKEDGFDSETKIAPDSWDLFNWIDYNIHRTKKDKPVFLSQEVSLKGYVTNIELAFSSSDFRDALDREELFEANREMIAILYPEKRYDDEEINGYAGDYNNLPEILQEYEAEYLIIRNTIAVWDERGWYNKSYQPVLNNGQAEVIYENDTWALLKVNPDWQPPAEEEGESEETDN